MEEKGALVLPLAGTSELCEDLLGGRVGMGC